MLSNVKLKCLQFYSFYTFWVFFDLIFDFFSIAICKLLFIYFFSFFFFFANLVFGLFLDHRLLFMTRSFEIKKKHPPSNLLSPIFCSASFLKRHFYQDCSVVTKNEGNKFYEKVSLKEHPRLLVFPIKKTIENFFFNTISNTNII